MTITPELRAEIETIIIQETEQYIRNRGRSLSTYRRICKELEPEMACCQYDLVWRATRLDGTPIISTTHQDMRDKVRSAISTLLLTAYQVERINLLPVDKEEDIREFFRDVLALVSAHQQKNALSSAGNT